MNELFFALLSSPPWKIEAVIEPAEPVAPATFDDSKNQSMSTPTGILSPLDAAEDVAFLVDRVAALASRR